MIHNKNIFAVLIASLVCITLSSFNVYQPAPNDASQPLKRSYKKNSEGKSITITQITLDKHTSREELIAVCSQLAKENVSLTFERVQIGRSFLGLAGKRRIRDVRGEIKLPNGQKEKFKAGGVFNFRYVKITYVQTDETDEYTISMVEKIN